MKKLMPTLVLWTLPLIASAHECKKFLNDGWVADEGYACSVSREDLSRLQFHKMEICIGSATYHLDHRRYAEAEYKWVPLSQYNNPFSRREGLHDKYFDKYYAGTAFEGENGEEAYLQDQEQFLLKTFREGSTMTGEDDYKAEIVLDLQNGRGQLRTYNRKPALMFKKSWTKNFDVRFSCKRVR